MREAVEETVTLARAGRGGRRVPRGLARAALAAALVAPGLAGAVLLAPPAGADQVRVDDHEAGREAWFLAIRQVRFSNDARGVRMVADHPNLVPAYLDRITFSMRVDRSVDRASRRTYRVSWLRGRGTRLQVQRPSTHRWERVRCGGWEFRRRAGQTDGRPGRVRISVPARCVHGAEQVRFRYLVADDSGGVRDVAPGLGRSRWTRWVSRG